MALAPVVLILLGCPWTEAPVPDPPPPPPSLASVADAPPPGNRIRTAPDRLPASVAPVRPMPLPAGRPILRNCSGMLGSRTGSRAPAMGVGPFWWATATGCAEIPNADPVLQEEPPPVEAAPPPASVPPAAAAPPPPDEAPAPAAARRTTGAAGGGAPARAPAPRPLADAAPAQPIDDLLPSLGYIDEGETAGAGEVAQSGPSDGDEEEIRDVPPAPERERERPRGPVLDWGGTVYLSNDDSMSLASAQRVLFALAHDVPIAPREVRKHELLNYFSFDAAAPPDGRTFGVLGSARREGDRLSVALAVRGANPARAPLDLTLVIDRSGSMAAEGKMAFVRRGLRRLVENLQRGDRIDVVLFDDRVCTPIEGLVIGRDPVDPLLKVIERMRPGGSTDLHAGLEAAQRIHAGRDAADTHGRSRRVLVITDAELNAGTTSPALVARVGEMLDRDGIHLSGIGVGRTFDDEVLDQLTERGRGAYVYLGSEAVVDRVFGVGFDSLVRTVADDVQFSLDLPDSLAMERFYGEEASRDARDVKPVHFHAGTTQVFLQDLAIRDGASLAGDPITMRIRFRDPATGEPVIEELRTTVGALLDADPHNVDKARALMAFADWVLAGAVRRRPDCGAPLEAWAARASAVPDDAEIAYVDGLVRRRCPGAPRMARRVELRLRIDSDVPVRAAELTCGSGYDRRELSPADTVARFAAIPGRCRVALEPVDGGPAVAVALEVPAVDSDLRCWVRGGAGGCG